MPSSTTWLMVLGVFTVLRENAVVEAEGKSFLVRVVGPGGGDGVPCRADVPSLPPSYVYGLVLRIVWRLVPSPLIYLFSPDS